MIAMDDLHVRHPLPPRLTMDEYVTWVDATLQQADPVKVARQKAIQEQIKVPFRIARDDGKVRKFTRNILWDVNPETFDIQKGRRLVVQRVLMLGTLDDLHLLKTLYPLSVIRNEVMRIKDWDVKMLNFISLWLDIPREQFLCCTHRPSHLKHWD